MIWNDDTEKTTGIIREKEIGMSKITYVEIVRCKDCEYYKDGFCYNPNTFDDGKTRGNTVPDWFCADGKRREEK